MGAIESHHIYGLQVRESADDGSDFTNPDADYRIVFLGEDGLLHAKDSSGTVTGLGGTGLTNPMTTQDDIIVGGASGTPGRLAKGTDGQVLTVDPSTHHLVWADNAGAADILDLPTAETDTSLVLAPDGAGGVEFRAETGGSGGGGLVLLGTYTASAVTSLDATTRNAAGQSGALFQTDYSAYLIKILEELLPSSGSQSLQFRFHTAGGFQAGTGYKVGGFAYVFNGSALYGQNGLSSGGFSNSADSSTTAGEGAVGTLDVFQPASSLAVKKVETHIRYVTGSQPKNGEGHISWFDSTSCDGFQLFYTSGNIAGKIAVYGYES